MLFSCNIWYKANSNEVIFDFANKILGIIVSKSFSISDLSNLFSDNNDKCVVEYEDGEVHKTMCYHVKFTDELYKDYFMEDRENGRKWSNGISGKCAEYSRCKF